MGGNGGGSPTVSPNAIDKRPENWAENVGMTERWWPEAPIRKPLASSRLSKPFDCKSTLQLHSSNLYATE